MPAESTVTTVTRAAFIRYNVRRSAGALCRQSLEPQTSGDRSVLRTSCLMMDVSRDVRCLFLIFSVERRDPRAACWHCGVFPRLQSDLCINTASAGLFDYYFSLRFRKVPAFNSGPALLTEIIRDVSQSLLANTWIEIQLTLLGLPYSFITIYYALIFFTVRQYLFVEILTTLLSEPYVN